MIVFPAIARGQNESTWLVVPGWVNPDSAFKRASLPIFGAVLYESGLPIPATALSAVHMFGTDLIVRGAFRYHDSHGVPHGRSWATSLTGAALFALAGVIAKSTAPRAARRANIRRAAEAEARARTIETSGSRPLPGLASGDTVNLRGTQSAAGARYALGAQLAAEDLIFRADGMVAARSDSAPVFRVVSVRRRVRSTNGATVAVGLLTGLGATVALCAKRTEACYPYTTAWAATTAGYGIGRLVPLPFTQTVPAAVMRR